MTDLNSADLQRRARRTTRSMVAAALRCGLVLLIAFLIRLEWERGDQIQHRSDAVKVDLKVLQRWIPEARSVAPVIGGVQPVCGEDGLILGGAMATLPEAQDVTGYRGPSNTLVVFDESSTVVGADLLSSDDTPEHVQAVVEDADFFRQFRGWVVGEPSTHRIVDSVTGATLTSLAIAEGVAVAMGSEKPSLRFPDQISTEDLRLVDAENLLLSEVDQTKSRLIGEDNLDAGMLIRTGSLVDSIAGYQGPSEVLIHLGPDLTTQKIALRRTFDNEPYSGYLNQEKYFWKVFLGKTLDEVSQIDLVAEQVEGVSGATMTSMAVAETIVLAAGRFQQRSDTVDDPIDRSTVRFGFHDLGTVAVIAFGVIVCLTRLRGIRWLRFTWNLVLFGYLGLVTGNLISLSVVSGWAARGVAWRLAPGLAAVVVVSFILSPVTGRNVYCSHICPHGAIQQLLRRPRRTSDRLRAALRRLTWVPGTILLAAVLATWLRMDLNLASWEPFNAYIWYVAGIGSLVVAAVSLLISWFVPMAYCRHACATGYLLEYLRRSARSDRFSRADLVSVALVAAMTIKLIL